MLIKFLRFIRRIDGVGHFLSELTCFAFFAGGAASLLSAADWPMWRLDAARSAASEEQLPDSLTLHWTRQLAPPAPAWPADQGKVRFDASYEPIAVDGRLIVPSMSRDCVTAYDVENGQQLWRVYTDGPVRFAPAASGDRVLFVSDDGFLYCLHAADGELCWKFRGGPSAQRVLGNDRLVSLWPARGAPVIQDGTVYFAAGIWPFMGTFIHALDVETGEVIWTNSGSGSTYLPQQHSGSVAFAGVAPQGYLSLSGDKLLVAGGMTVPAAYDRLTGKFLYYRLSERELGKQYGGYAVTAGGDWFSNHGGLYRLADGEPVAKLNVVVRDGNEILATTGRHLLGLQNNLATIKTTKVDKKGQPTIEESEGLPEMWRCELPDPVRKIHLKAGRWIWASDGDASIYALEIDRSVAEEPTCRIVWKGDIEGTVWSMLVADQRLFVISLEGAVFCFGATQSVSQPISTWSSTEPTPTSQPTDSRPAAESPVSSLLEMLPDRAGYAVVDGQHSDWAAEIATTSDLHVIVMEPDAARKQALRERLERAQLLGQRVAVVSGHPTDGTLPPYLANLLITGLDPNLPADAAREAIAIAANSLRPYGGVAFVLGSDLQRQAVREAFTADPPKASPTVTSDFNSQTAIASQIQVTTSDFNNALLLTRPGAIPGSGSWTHQSADAGNTLVSRDEHPRTPLGLLWFGGPSNRDVLPRHGHGPTPQVIGGRLFIEGRNMLRAVDVYTGRLLWQKPFKDVGLYHDITYHHPGAGAIGGNYTCTSDAVYLIWQRRCLKLDPKTGEQLAEFYLPPDTSGERPVWGYISALDDVLIAGSSPMVLLSRHREQDEPKQIYTQFGEGSQRIVVMDRHTGEVRWQRDARFNFRHNAIAAGDGKLFCLDRMTEKRLASLRRRGRPATGDFCLYALDLQTGEVLWQSTDHAFGTWLAYSPRTKLLLQAGSRNRDRAADEVGEGLAVMRADSGELLWRRDVNYAGPPLLYDDTIVTQGQALDLLTGQPKQRRHPLTGESLPWSFERKYGCNTAIGCVNLLTFRSGAAGYFDLANDGGTGNLGGFRSGCTSNLIAADGILNAPDYTRTCTCSYQNQCSVALIHMPSAEMWTFNPFPFSTARVHRLGLNFGAPGDRRAENGVLWLDYPSVGGDSPDVPVFVAGDAVKYVRRHASVVQPTDQNWIYASGVQNLSHIAVRIATASPEASNELYSVKLMFCEPGADARRPVPVQIRLQGDVVVSRLDVLEQAGGYDRGVSLRLDQVPISDTLEVSIRPQSSPAGIASNVELPTLCGIEIQREPSHQTAR